eukprot:TRINITY_DN729_c0_g1_i3.p1 TRINITY_DN729_c0_g1~~TRINITY_DN729_c0_g1_i3.p1  ORF type:complete len:559 (+),score=117.57 TRINITY_DN729_c0_g1_i3:77-1678(+)
MTNFSSFWVIGPSGHLSPECQCCCARPRMSELESSTLIKDGERSEGGVRMVLARMPRWKLLLFVVTSLLVVAACIVIPVAVIARNKVQPAPPTTHSCADAARMIIQAAMHDSSPHNYTGLAFERLSDLTTIFGPRLSGSKALEDALDWILQKMDEDGLANVQVDNVTVPAWVRGHEYVTMNLPRKKDIGMMGLGGSVNTSSEGLTAPVIVVTSWDDLDSKASEVPGKIVVYNVPFVEYSTTVLYRTQGAIRAARYGAVAGLVRSIGPVSLYTPHTGSMAYASDVPQIPYAAITSEDAQLMQRMQDLDMPIELTIYMESHYDQPAQSRNVMAELRGTELPDEIVVVGGHTDSWDVGNGAMDDAGGVLVSWEAVRLLQRLGLVPRRTVRVVGWTNEENGLAGGNAYADLHEGVGQERHVFAIESDGGVTAPQGLGISAPSASIYNMYSAIAPLLSSIGAGNVSSPGGGADIDPLRAKGVPVAGLLVDRTKYFWYHHTNADTFDKVDPVEIRQCVATMATYAYCVANMEEDLVPNN